MTRKYNFEVTKKTASSFQEVEISNEVDLLLDIDEHLFNTQYRNTPDGKIHPSSIGGCPRYIYYWMKQYPFTDYTPHDSRLLRIFDTGKVWETQIKRYFRHMNILVSQEKNTPINADRVSGRADVVIFHKNKYYVVELKTANSNSFSNTPIQSHLYQISAYMYYLNIDSGKLMYTNKDDQTMKEFTLKLDHPVVKYTVDLIKMYNHNFENNICPDVQTIKPGCSNKSCAYFTRCDKTLSSAHVEQ